jgi:hypothetical protein
VFLFLSYNKHRLEVKPQTSQNKKNFRKRSNPLRSPETPFPACFDFQRSYSIEKITKPARIALRSPQGEPSELKKGSYLPQMVTAILFDGSA